MCVASPYRPISLQQRLLDHRASRASSVVERVGAAVGSEPRAIGPRLEQTRAAHHCGEL